MVGPGWMGDRLGIPGDGSSVLKLTVVCVLRHWRKTSSPSRSTELPKTPARVSSAQVSRPPLAIHLYARIDKLLYMSAAPSMLSVHLVTPTERANFLEARAQWQQRQGINPLEFPSRHIKGQLWMLLCPRFASPSWLILPPIRKQSPLRCTDSSNQCRGLGLSEFLRLLRGAKGL
ncbi:unnamed protein product [Leuciscus chuanchicus]